MADSHLYLVDGSGYIFRAYYALPQNLTNPQGQPVGAVYGFTTMLLKLLTDFEAPYIAVIFDAARENFRNALYSDYKANRSEPPEDLIPQFGLIRTATEAFGIPAIQLEGYEADDLIASYARLARARGMRVTIVGSDKDLMQLVTDGVTMYDPIKQLDIGPDQVRDKFGVGPERVIDVQALVGDSVDNIPGVPGVGMKTAAQLINTFGSLEAVLAAAETIKQPKRREALLTHANQARLSKQLVTLDAQVQVPLALEKLEAHDPRRPKLASFVEAQGFRSLLARIKTAEGEDGANAAGESATRSRAPAPDPDQARDGNAVAREYRLLTTHDALVEWLGQVPARGRLAIDTETTHLTPSKAKLVGLSLSYAPGKAAYLPVAHQTLEAQLDLATVVAELQPLLADPALTIIGHNVKYDLQILDSVGMALIEPHDTMLLSYVLDGTRHGHGLDELAKHHFDVETLKYKDVAGGSGKRAPTFDQVGLEQARDYAAEDADLTLRLYDRLAPRLAGEDISQVYEGIERPLIPVIARMEDRGIAVDLEMLEALSQDFRGRLQALETEIHALAGLEFNVASPKQVGDVLFGKLGLGGGKRTRTGAWSTDVSVLEQLADAGHPIAERLLDWRQLAKLKSTYADALRKEINPRTGRVHTSFSMAVTNTGRLSSSEPNLQNIPIRTEEGRKIRQAFVAAPGHRLLSVDYSQIELRLAAEMADIAALKAAFRDRIDIHALTASRVFGVELEAVTPELRRQAKAINFGIIYGISGWGLAKQLGCEPGEANAFIRAYLARFPELQEYMEARKAEAREHGYVRTRFGRKCVIQGIRARNAASRGFAERQAINAPLQGTAADLIKLAMIQVDHTIEHEGLPAQLLLQVHDELLLEVSEDAVDAVAERVVAIMEGVAELDVPLVAEAGSGPTWAAAH